jgi:heme/copper-type cytochrome/quinol oxidase subunit 3
MKRLTLSHRLLIGSGLLFAGFVVCQLSYAAIGQRIEPDGTLREPFFLIPISVLLLLSSSASLVGAAVARWRQGR